MDFVARFVGLQSVFWAGVLWPAEGWIGLVSVFMVLIGALLAVMGKDVVSVFHQAADD